AGTAEYSEYAEGESDGLEWTPEFLTTDCSDDTDAESEVKPRNTLNTRKGELNNVLPVLSFSVFVSHIWRISRFSSSSSSLDILCIPQFEPDTNIAIAARAVARDGISSMQEALRPRKAGQQMRSAQAI